MSETMTIICTVGITQSKVFFWGGEICIFPAATHPKESEARGPQLFSTQIFGTEKENSLLRLVVFDEPTSESPTQLRI